MRLQGKNRSPTMGQGEAFLTPQTRLSKASAMYGLQFRGVYRVGDGVFYRGI
jgi:hypothetical protein